MINKDEYISIVMDRIKNKNSQNLLISQIENFYKFKIFYTPKKHKYKIGDNVILKKGTLLHGTYKNIEGLKLIVKNGLLTGQFTDEYRNGKYLYTVGVRNLNKTYYLKNYINNYSFCSLRGYVRGNKIKKSKEIKKIIPYDKRNDLIDIINKFKINTWQIEQTKEARFLPSLSQNFVQIGIIFNGNSKEIKQLKTGDILNPQINIKDVKEFVHPDIYKDFFVKQRDHKDIFFTDRESAILFGIPPNFIEGILVGRKYEKNIRILKHIKTLLPNAYICNLDGKIIME